MSEELEGEVKELKEVNGRLCVKLIALNEVLYKIEAELHKLTGYVNQIRHIGYPSKEEKK